MNKQTNHEALVEEDNDILNPSGIRLFSWWFRRLRQKLPVWGWRRFGGRAFSVCWAIWPEAHIADFEPGPMCEDLRGLHVEVCAMQTSSLTVYTLCLYSENIASWCHKGEEPWQPQVDCNPCMDRSTAFLHMDSVSILEFFASLIPKGRRARQVLQSDLWLF